jgi:hypothetical protein
MASPGTTRWMCVRYCGDVHVIPMVGKHIHTIPLCWCKPKSEYVVTHGGGVRRALHSHNDIHRLCHILIP